MRQHVSRFLESQGRCDIARRDAAQPAFIRFNNRVNEFLDSISAYELNQIERDWVVMELWKYFDGSAKEGSSTYARVSENHRNFGNPNPQPTNQGASEMKETSIVVTKTYVNGTDIAALSDDQLINTVRKLEADIENLKSIKTASKKIAEKIAALEASLAQVVELLDAK